MHRSYLFAPGHNAKLLRRVFEAGADAVILHLEDAVPPDAKQHARVMVAGVLAERSAWVRINTVPTDLAAADLDAVAGLAAGIRNANASTWHSVQARWSIVRTGRTNMCREQHKTITNAQTVRSFPVTGSSHRPSCP